MSDTSWTRDASVAGQHAPADIFGEAFAFDSFEVVPARKVVLDGGKPVPVGARAFDLLVALLRRVGDVVGKGELLAQAWPGLHVAEGNLRVHITGLRKALGDGRGGRRFIVNTPGRGYCFVAPVVRVDYRRPDGSKPGPHRGNLPGTTMQIFGRDHLVALLTALLPQRRLITVTGAGGIGKTTVALAVAHAMRPSYADGAYLIDLAPVAEAALVPTALASALGLPVGSSTPVPSLLAVLRDKAMLLVLDNCEHVVEAAAALVHDVIRNAPSIHVLATSRQPLRVAEEHVQRLPPLELPPAIPRITATQALGFAAVRLFAERAAALLDTFVLSDANAPTVALICRRLDGLALAIEFAAARVETLGVRGIADRLDDRFRLLKRGTRLAHPRHQTLKAAFDWSFDLLPDKAGLVLRRLAVFAGQFTFADALAVVGGDMDAADVADEFTTLVSASMMAADAASDPVTYRLLESTRAYAMGRLTESGERALLSRRHATHVLRLLGGAGTVPAPADRIGQQQSHALDNLRVALDWAFTDEGDAQLGVALTIAGVPLWQRLSLTEECRSRAEAALATLTGTDARRGAQAMQLHAARGSALALRSDADSTAAWTDALAIAEAIGDVEYQLRALRGLWRNTYSAGDPKTAHDFAQRFAVLAAASGNDAMQPVSDHMVGMDFFYAGDLAAARQHIGKAMSASEAGSGVSDVLRFSIEQTVVTSVNLSKILWLQGYPEQAARMAERSVQFASVAGHELSLAYALAYAACRIALQTGDLPGAERYLGRLADLVSWDPLGQWAVIYRCWTGILRDRMGDPGQAADMLEAALRDIPEGSFRLHHTRFLGEWAQSLGRAGRVRQALEVVGKAIAICDRLDERWFFPELLRIKGEIVLGAGGRDAAALAEADFEAALGWAARQGALAWELRAVTSLVRLFQARSWPGRARDRLASVYSRFREGFATSDLLAAKALLDGVLDDAACATPHRPYQSD